MNTKHRKTLKTIFSNPINGNLEWQKIEALLIALGTNVVEGKGSGVGFFLNRERLDIHRPHPGKEALGYRVKAVRKFLIKAGVNG